MAKKISSSNLPPEFEQWEAEAKARMAEKKCQHFEVGTFVNFNHKRAEVVARDGNGMMIVRHDNGEEDTLYPYALQWEANHGNR